MVALDDASVAVTVLAPPDFRYDAPPGARVRTINGPPATAHWTGRRMWELSRLRELVRKEQASAVLHFSGVAVPGLRVPQIGFYHNPLPFLTGRRESRSPTGRARMALQLAAMRRYASLVDGAVAPSRYMRDLVLLGIPQMQDVPFAVVPHGLSGEFADEEDLPAGRRNGRIVTVSNWAPHKNIEALLVGLSMMESDVTLEVIGPWAGQGYRRSIERMVRRLDLRERVIITGYVPSSEMRDRVRRARLFCLLSRSESFGLPALEAQALGTPVIVSSDTAMAEVCGAGAIAIAARPVDFVNAASSILIDDAKWMRLSAAAKENARRYSWEYSAGRLMRCISEISRRASPDTPVSRTLQGTAVPPLPS